MLSIWVYQKFCYLTLYQTIPTFSNPKEDGFTTPSKKHFENIEGKKENAGYQHFLFFPQFSTLSKTRIIFSSTCILTSAPVQNFVIW